MPRHGPDIRSLIARGESSTVEFKLRPPPDRVIANHLSALANSAGGVLIIGVNEKGETVGLSDDEANRALARLRRVVASLFSWPVEVGDVVIDGKRVVYASVKSGSTSPSAYCHGRGTRIPAARRHLPATK